MLTITIVNAQQHEQRTLPAGEWTIGSRPSGERGVIVRDSRMANEQLRVAFVDKEGRAAARVVNAGRMVLLPGGRRILAGATRDVELPTKLVVGKTTILIDGVDRAQKVDEALTGLPRLDDDPLRFAAEMERIGQAPSSNTLAFWFEALGKMQRSVAGSPEFFHEAAYAAFDPGGLDAAMVLLRDGDAWRIAGSHISQCELGAMYRPTLLERVRRERRTLFHDARRSGDDATPLTVGADDRTSSYAAISPILDATGDVVGALYGVRFDHPQNHRHGIRPLEAQFLQAVADAVSAALIREQRETEAVQARARFEQVFSPRLVRALERDPQMLDGTQREVTTLFCDLRGFSRIAEQLGPRELHMLVGDVMDRFTEHVVALDGVVIDYFGDGLACFWNAPVDQPDHPRLACECALRMIRELPDISADWYGLLGRPLQAGVGIHTGVAVVGNSGSRKRIKYGPRGHSVNVASRLQAFTKEIGASIVVTDEVRQALDARLPARLVGRSRLPGLDETFTLHELLAQIPTDADATRFALIDAAAMEFDQGRIDSATALIESTGDWARSDGVAKWLTQRCLESLGASSQRDG